MLNRSASLAMSTSALKAVPGKLDIKRHSPCILYFPHQLSHCPLLCLCRCTYTDVKMILIWLDQFRFSKNKTYSDLKIVSMIRKYHNHKTQTTPWHREEEPLNHHETPGRQIKQSNQLSLPHQDDCNTRIDIKKRTTKHRTITDSHN